MGFFCSCVSECYLLALVHLGWAEKNKSPLVGWSVLRVASSSAWRVQTGQEFLFLQIPKLFTINNSTPRPVLQPNVSSGSEDGPTTGETGMVEDRQVELDVTCCMSLNKAQQECMIWSLKPQLCVLPPGYGVFEAFERLLAAPGNSNYVKIEHSCFFCVWKIYPPNWLSCFHGLAPASSQAQGWHSLSHHYGQGENWKRKSEKTYGLR